jgi:hypothetical protein
MYSFNKTAFNEWLKENEIVVSLSHIELGMLMATMVGAAVEGKGNTPDAALAHLANEISEQEDIFINGKQYIVPKFTETLNVN